MARHNITLDGEKNTFESSVPANSRNSLKANRVLGDEEPSVTSEANTADDFRANGHGMGIVRQLIYASSGGDADPQSFRVSQRSMLCPILLTR
jgi:hypothetical protein